MNPALIVTAYRILSAARAVAPVASRVLFAVNARNMANNMRNAFNDQNVRRELVKNKVTNAVTNKIIKETVGITLPTKEAPPCDSLANVHDRIPEGIPNNKTFTAPTNSNGGNFQNQIADTLSGNHSSKIYYGTKGTHLGEPPLEANLFPVPKSPLNNLEIRIEPASSTQIPRDPAFEAFIQNLRNETLADQVKYSQDPEFRKQYDDTIQDIFTTLIQSNSTADDLVSLLSNRLKLHHIRGTMRGFFGWHLDNLIEQLDPIFFVASGPQTGKLRYPQPSHAASEIILPFIERGLKKEGLKKFAVETNLSCVKSIRQEGFVRRFIKRIANIPHAIKETFVVPKDLALAIAKHQFNQDLPLFLQSCAEQNFQHAHELLNLHGHDKIMTDILNELYNGIKQSFAKELNLSKNLTADLDPLLNQLIQLQQNPWEQYNAIARYIQEIPVIDGVSLKSVFFDGRGILRILPSDPFVNSLSWPSVEINDEKRFLLNSLLFAKQATHKPADHRLLNLALQDLNASLQERSFSSGHLAKAVYHSFAHPESNQVIRQLGNIFESFTVESQQTIQSQLQSMTSNGLACFERLADDFVFDNDHDQLFTRFVQHIEQIRTLNKAGDVAQASYILASTGSLFDGLSGDSKHSTQQEAFNAFFSPNGLCKLFDHSEIPCTFSTDLAKSENIKRRDFVNACLALRPIVSPEQCHALNQSLRLVDNAMMYPPLREEYDACAAFIFDSVVNAGNQGLSTGNDELFKLLPALAETGGFPELISLRRDCLKLLSAGIKKYGDDHDYPYSLGLADLLSAISQALESGKQKNYPDGVRAILPHSRLFGVELESSIPLQERFKEHLTRRNVGMAVGATSAATAGLAARYYWKNNKAFNDRRPTIESPGENESDSEVTKNSSEAAAGTPIPPDPKNNETPSDSEDYDSSSSDSSDDELSESDSESEEEEGCPPSCPEQYEKLKGELNEEQYTSIIKCTKHGLKRLKERFKPEEVKMIIESPDFIKIQNNGAKIFIKKIGEKYGVIATSQRTKKVVTGINNMSFKRLLKQAQKYGWTL